MSSLCCVHLHSADSSYVCPKQSLHSALCYVVSSHLLMTHCTNFLLCKYLIVSSFEGFAMSMQHGFVFILFSVFNLKGNITVKELMTI